jgi:hypothetical protein
LAFCAAALLCTGGYFGLRHIRCSAGDNAGVFSIQYEKPSGWEEEVPGPFTLFIFRHPKGLGTLRASINEVHAAVNPTPDLDTEGLAQHFLEVTEQNLPGWKAERLDDLHSGPERFSFIRRQGSGRVVYTAFCAKGNTTLLVSLTGEEKNEAGIETLVPVLKQIVQSVRFVPKQISLEE